MRRRLAVLLTALALTGGIAWAEGGSTTRDGRTLSVSKVKELRVEGETVHVRGSGYDRSKGIYVAFCVDNGPGKVPTPCGGGADTDGTSGNSVWISDFPPAYGTGLARPYGDGGSFDVEIHVKAQLRADDPKTAANEGVDCLVVRCAVVTRNDRTRSEDRGQDLLVPVSFARPVAAAPSRPGTAPAPTPGAAGAAADPAPASPATAERTPDAAASATSSAVASPAAPSGPSAPAGVAADSLPGGEVTDTQRFSARRTDDDGLLYAALLGVMFLATAGGGAGSMLLRRLRTRRGATGRA